MLNKLMGIVREEINILKNTKFNAVPVESVEESYNKARKVAAAQRANIPRATQTVEERNQIRRVSRYWKQWTGSRFVTVENPIAAMTAVEYFRSEWVTADSVGKPTIIDRTCKTNPVTGDLEITNTYKDKQ